MTSEIAVGSNLMGYCKILNNMIVVNASVADISFPSQVYVAKVIERIRGLANQ